ncbi:nitrogenase component 1 [Megasphaera vaginalis (ex Srinivasan et al. 2021)]|uniref:Oxidoreductase, nitrogenase component 1 domain protein n=1 Tax=Megasphaera vaginalis (ex Srinivasan et al. 2021) TaxID=1111454 RepID=U7UIJ8_9FIRM|nr:nitrogenase component 1 [Megasphaera vaginalis (ex Srinivasan et al. 2021)]ERT58714.1 oxidoreductase, nitrogenase component 1 domain protein [Megasphaera vaginalis (ex Srinivasan et al. 2021)]
MKGLWKYISPFAPDQAGVSSVLYELGGIVVICDAGGCAGNICGFDEPRWFGRRSAVFSAGLRDMDAVLGRDDRLVDKLCEAAKTIDASFAAIIGTPVPAVIGTDYRALKRLAEKRLHLPVMAIDSSGMDFYDTGIEKAYAELFRTFTVTDRPRRRRTVGVIGASPLDLLRADDVTAITAALKKAGWQDVLIYGRGSLDVIEEAATAEKNIVLSPAGLKSAAYLERYCNTPYEAAYPVLPHLDCAVKGRTILVVHQQVAANALRQQLLDRGAAAVTVATWFTLAPQLAAAGDVALREEDDFIALADCDRFDVIVGDSFFKRGLKHFHGTFVDVPHVAISGRTATDD